MMTNCEIKGVTTRGRKTTTHDVQTNSTNVHTEEPLVVNHDKLVESNEVLDKDQPQTTNEPVIQTYSEEQTPSISFPERLRKEKEEAQQRKFLENLKQLYINLPFIEAQAQMPKYAKFLKSLLTNKARLEEACTITMNERCSSVLLNKLPSKEKDPRSLGEPKATRMSLELADMSIQYPRGIIENVLIKVDKYVLPIDFVIMDMPEDSRMTARPDGIKSKHLYSASANEIDEKRPEQKSLPNHLEYAYLQGDKSFSIIISSKLSEKEKILLFQVLEKYSSWVSLIHVVPKKGGMTVVLNDNNELIPSQTVTGWRVMLARCEETNLVLNWEKCHVMVKEGIVLGHKISGVSIEVDRAKIDVIAKLPYPTNIKGVRSFLGHVGFYRRFIKDFSMISKPMTKLLMKDAKFNFSDDCKTAFNILKERLTTPPIIISPDWNVPFELMCDASDSAVGAVLGQQIDGKFKPVYYASKTLNNTQEHYTTTEKELLVVVFSFDKFCLYLVLSKIVVYTDHSALKYLFSKQDAKPRLIRPTRGHHSTSITRRKVYEFGFFWPSIFKDAKDYVMRCDACQRSGNVSSRSEMPQNNIQAFRTAYKTPTRVPPTAAAKNRFMELNELMELRDGAYKNTRIYKERTKKWHDSRL
ncbi:reverse transcriptase domain-containing protein [Tanacetum coccineum]